MVLSCYLIYSTFFLLLSLFPINYCSLMNFSMILTNFHLPPLTKFEEICVYFKKKLSALPLRSVWIGRQHPKNWDGISLENLFFFGCHFQHFLLCTVFFFFSHTRHIPVRHSNTNTFKYSTCICVGTGRYFMSLHVRELFWSMCFTNAHKSMSHSHVTHWNWRKRFITHAL